MLLHWFDIWHMSYVICLHVRGLFSCAESALFSIFRRGAGIKVTTTVQLCMTPQVNRYRPMLTGWWLSLRRTSLTLCPCPSMEDAGLHWWTFCQRPLPPEGHCTGEITAYILVKFAVASIKCELTNCSSCHLYVFCVKYIAWFPIFNKSQQKKPAWHFLTNMVRLLWIFRLYIWWA